MFTIRRAGPQDVEALVRLRLALLREIGHVTIQTNDDELECLVSAHRHYFTDDLVSGNYVGFVAVSEDAVIGNGGVVLLKRPPYIGNLAGLEGYLMNMYTEPSFRRMGVGAEILTRILAARGGQRE